MVDDGLQGPFSNPPAPPSAAYGPPSIPNDPRDRMTVVLNVYHEHQGEPPHCVEVRRSWLLSDDESETYARRYVVGGKAKQGIREQVLVDFGWMESIGTIVVENLEGTIQPPVNPTEEEIKEAQEAILYLIVVRDRDPISFPIQPGRMMYFEPPTQDPTKFRLELASKDNRKVRCKVHLFPV